MRTEQSITRKNYLADTRKYARTQFKTKRAQDTCMVWRRKKQQKSHVGTSCRIASHARTSKRSLQRSRNECFTHHALEAYAPEGNTSAPHIWELKHIFRKKNQTSQKGVNRWWIRRAATKKESKDSFENADTTEDTSYVQMRIRSIKRMYSSHIAKGLHRSEKLSEWALGCGERWRLDQILLDPAWQMAVDPTKWREHKRFLEQKRCIKKINVNSTWP